EQTALKLCKGAILDVGCGAGNHALWLQSKGYKVKGIDISKGAIEVCKKRGVTYAELKPLLEETQTFDTILLLMNGTGIFQEVSQVSQYLTHLKNLLNPKGQILIDSSDIKYMFEDDDGGYWMDLNTNYYGELDYYLSYKGEEEPPMKWLYLDFETLKRACNLVGLTCEKIKDGKHFDYLARLIPAKAGLSSM
ncbi:class I SAM-dependent methyltransferase, partial [Paucihalobacter sp.]|uniref:class I SAM-dependent methyltransferase n=1 Tax=Paucihalobacter sp. TaxID=2850405 RepID=UPI003D16191E